MLLAAPGERHFSAGLDLGDRPADELPAFLQEGERRLGRAAAAVAACPVPVIGVLNGAAFGGALEIAIACDWRIARRGALLGMPAARLGVVYAAEGLRRFVAAMGPARTRRLFLTGTPVDADEALRIGLVDEVVPEAELWDAARGAAAEVARAAPLAVAGTRAIVRALEDGAPPDAVREAADAWRARAFGSGGPPGGPAGVPGAAAAGLSRRLSAASSRRRRPDESRVEVGVRTERRRRRGLRSSSARTSGATVPYTSIVRRSTSSAKLAKSGPPTSMWNASDATSAWTWTTVMRPSSSSRNAA